MYGLKENKARTGPVDWSGGLVRWTGPRSAARFNPEVHPRSVGQKYTPEVHPRSSLTKIVQNKNNSSNY